MHTLQVYVPVCVVPRGIWGVEFGLPQLIPINVGPGLVDQAALEAGSSAWCGVVVRGGFRAMLGSAGKSGSD